MLQVGDRAKEDQKVDKTRRRRDEYRLSLTCFRLGIIDRNPDSKGNANKDLTVANLKDFMVHKDIQLVKAVKRDGGIGTLQKLVRANISDPLIARVNYDKETGEFYIDNEAH